MNKHLVAAYILSFVALALVGSASAVQVGVADFPGDAELIDFDSQPQGDLNDTAFLSQGVTIVGGLVTRPAGAILGNSDPNVLEAGGVTQIELLFSSPQNMVGAYVHHDAGNSPAWVTLSLYDQDNLLIESISSEDSVPPFSPDLADPISEGLEGFLGLREDGLGPSVVRAVFSGQLDSFSIDDVRFWVPEPTTCVLGLLGVTAMGFRRRLD